MVRIMNRILLILEVIAIIIVSICIVLFAKAWYDLYRFRTCYDNNFKYAYCTHYKNY